MTPEDNKINNLYITRRASQFRRLASNFGTFVLFIITSLSLFAVLFIFYFIAKDAIPFFRLEGFKEFFTTSHWYPSREPGEFGALSIFYGSGIVTLGAIIIAVPAGIFAALCLSDILPFSTRQIVKPVIEILASIPSVAYGFFALVVFSPLLQEKGGRLFEIALWVTGLPILFLASSIISEILSLQVFGKVQRLPRAAFFIILVSIGVAIIWNIGAQLGTITITSGTNALNVSVILGIMALPTVISVSEDALQSVGMDLRMGSYALGATRAETLVKAILPAASSGILAAILLGIMRAIGETMVVWMASGNSAQIPTPWYDITSPVRTLTATIAGDMGEADHVTGSSRYHVLFAMALCLLVFSFLCNIASEWIIKKNRRKLKGE